MGGGMGMFNVAPEKVGTVHCPTVCLDYGKKDPRPAVPYKIVPVEQYTDNPAVQELGRMLGTGQINQRAAQAAAWHLQNGLSWEQLAAKQLRSAGMEEPYFSPLEIRVAMQLSVMATNLAEQRKKTDENRRPSENRASLNTPSASM